MIESIIRWSVTNRVLVLLVSVIFAVGGVLAIKHTPVDAIPDLSDVQVIVKTSYPGQSPQVVQDQVTFPLTSALLAVPNAKTVRGFSFFGDSYIYVIFDDKTDLYWARSRVLEYLNQASGALPTEAKPELGPDATGVGWVYIYALTDTTGQHDLSALTSLQNWFLKYELQSVSGVSEVATIGGMVKQYQVNIDPVKLQGYQVPLSHVVTALRRGNQASGASVIEMAEAEYMLTVSGYIQSVEDIKQIPLGKVSRKTALRIGDIAEVTLGPQMRRGVAELDGEGEVVGAVVVMRSGENAQRTIDNIEQKLTRLSAALPDGVEIVTVYNRANLINRAVDNLGDKLVEELLLVAAICALFLFHLRSSLVAMITLPLGIAMAFAVMYWQGINANIMSLGGIAIAIGAMTDGAIVMIENMHKHMEKTPIDQVNRWDIVVKSAVEVGPALFFSLLIITVSFLPVFMLEAQEGKLFAPLAYTKTYAMAAAAGLAITLVPVLMGYFVRGHVVAEKRNPVNRLLVASYLPVLKLVLKFPKTTLLLAVLVTLSSWIPLSKLGTEFMPPLDEGDLMYMPTTYPSISIDKARQLLQQTDRLIRTVPEVETVFGKVGRAQTATDPAPLTMIETFIQLKPKAQWRAGITVDDLKAQFDQLVKFPGLTNAWVMPIKTRIDMLATGIKTPVGLKIAGTDLTVIEQLGAQVEQILEQVQGTASVYAERVAGGRYIDLQVNRSRAASYGLNVKDVQDLVASAVGGMTVTFTTEGQARYPINIRYPQDYRDSPETLMSLPIVTPAGEWIRLGDVVDITTVRGPVGIKSENARLNGWVFIDIEGISIGEYVAQANTLLSEQLALPVGYSMSWAGQFEYMQRAKDKLRVVVPFTLAVIVLLLYLNFKSVIDVGLILVTLPMALVGGIWLLYWADFQLSVAVGVGFIALAGVAVEIGVIMLVYLHQGMVQLKQEQGAIANDEQVKTVIINSAGRRIRPVMMTVATIVFGLLPVLLSEGTGAEVMSRISAPVVGGMLSALLLTLLVLPASYWLVYARRFTR